MTKAYRAEARERLKNYVGARFSAEALVIALAGGRIGQSDWSFECNWIISLLDDDADYRRGYEDGLKANTRAAFAAAKCDEIEREIAERYIELPVDADGVPVQIGDLVTNPFFEGSREVRSLTKEQGNPYWHLGVDEGKVTAHTCRHVKPRNVEDVLEDFAHNYNSIGGKLDEDELWDKLLADTSAELREMITYIPERTCKDVNGDGYTFICSECSYELYMPFGWNFSYCGGCGAKVVQ